jgi:hypothetical protein
MNALCPHRMTGLCDDPRIYNGCEHAILHDPYPCAGATCVTRQGTCRRTDYIVTCKQLTKKRVSLFSKFGFDTYH